MKNKMDVKNMLERNLGIIDNSIKLDSEGLREILDVNKYNFERSIKQELKNLFEEGEILINIISCKDKNNVLFRSFVKDIARQNTDNIFSSNPNALLYIEANKLYLNECLVGMLCSKYSTLYRYVIMSTFREVVENLKKAGLKIQGLEDITAANIYKDVTKQYLNSVKEIFIEKYKDRMKKGGSVSERENYWIDYKYNLLENIAATNEMLNHLFNDDFEEEINELHDEV